MSPVGRLALDDRAFVRAFELAGPLPAPARAELAALLRPRRYRTGDRLLSPGERAEQAHFVVRGLVRELYLDRSGREHTRAFVGEGGFTGSLRDLLGDQPATTLIEALEPTLTLAFDHRAFRGLCERHAELARAALRFTEALYVRKAEREHDLLALSAAERHAKWLAAEPALDPRITRRHLASYLGISPEHLSRLRAAAHKTPSR
jgi:CRP-like cAMP-binding protein